MAAVPQGQAVTSEVPKITSDQLITRHLAAGHLLSHMLFPDDPERCRAYEIIFRTKFSDSWSERIARLGKEVLEKKISDVRSLSPDKVPSSIVDPFAWVRRCIFDTYLLPFGGAIGAVLSLKDSPSEQTLKVNCARRWLGIVYTGRLTLLLGSINQHTSEGASLNKAIHVMRETDGNNKEIKAVAKQFNYPYIYDSSLKKAWRTFKSVAHLCAAYVLTELRYRGISSFSDIFRDFAMYAEHPALLEQFTAFSFYCTFGRFTEEFVTSFRPHGQQNPLISREEIYSLDRNLGFSTVFDFSFPPLIEEEIAALERYRAPKSLV